VSVSGYEGYGGGEVFFRRTTTPWYLLDVLTKADGEAGLVYATKREARVAASAIRSVGWMPRLERCSWGPRSHLKRRFRYTWKAEWRVMW